MVPRLGIEPGTFRSYSYGVIDQIQVGGVMLCLQIYRRHSTGLLR